MGGAREWRRKTRSRDMSFVDPVQFKWSPVQFRFTEIELVWLTSGSIDLVVGSVDTVLVDDFGTWRHDQFDRSSIGIDQSQPGGCFWASTCIIGINRSTCWIDQSHALETVVLQRRHCVSALKNYSHSTVKYRDYIDSTVESISLNSATEWIKPKSKKIKEGKESMYNTLWVASHEAHA